jgi:hypothetical protein
MGEILGLGITHAPMFQFPDEHMADILRKFIKKEDVPESFKNVKNWPEAMQKEWGNDEGLLAAKRHREEVVHSFRKLRAELDAFNPDFVLIWGDDQYENFKEDVVPPFCVYIYDELDCLPYKNSKALSASRNVWNEPPDKIVPVKGHREGASYLVKQLLSNDFDISYAYKPHHHPTLAHAYMRTMVYLDYDQKGFDYPLVPFHVNCYGSELMTMANIKEAIENAPPAPNPRRCYDLGKMVGQIIRESPYRVAVIGSSSWSHAFLTKKHYGVYPDVEADRARFKELEEGRQAVWRDLDLEQIVEAGQHELLNWVCLAGAMEGHKVDYAQFAETHIFNSTKVTAIFKP